MPDFDAVGFMQADTTRKPSDAVWKGCVWKEIPPYGFNRSGVALFDDFTTATAALTNAAISNYKVVGTTGVAALTSASDGGLVQLQPGAVANQETYLVWGSALGSVGEILNATMNQMWFECRVKLNDIVNNGFFFGLARPADVASGFLVNTTTVLASTVKAVGFNVANATPANIDIVYANAAAPTIYKANAKTATTSAFVKLGFRFGGHADNNLIRFYVDGTEVANTAGTKGVGATATNFPNSTQLTPVFAAKNVGGAGGNACSIDWWRMALIIEDATQGVA